MMLNDFKSVLMYSLCGSTFMFETRTPSTENITTVLYEDSCETDSDNTINYNKRSATNINMPVR